MTSLYCKQRRVTEIYWSERCLDNVNKVERAPLQRGRSDAGGPMTASVTLYSSKASLRSRSEPTGRGRTESRINPQRSWDVDMTRCAEEPAEWKTWETKSDLRIRCLLSWASTDIPTGRISKSKSQQGGGEKILSVQSYLCPPARPLHVSAMGHQSASTNRHLAQTDENTAHANWSDSFWGEGTDSVRVGGADASPVPEHKFW